MASFLNQAGRGGSLARDSAMACPDSAERNGSTGALPPVSSPAFSPSTLPPFNRCSSKRRPETLGNKTPAVS